MKEIGIKGKYLSYNGKPLVRVGQEIYYGDLSDKCYLFMMIMSETKKGSVSLPDKILVQIITTADNSILKQKMVEKSLFEAFDLGCAWLERALAS